MQQLHRPEIDVQIELESQTQENVAGMLIAGDARIAEGAEEDRIDVVAQMTKTGFRQRLVRFEVMVGGIWKVFPVQRESVLGRDAIEYRDRGFDHLGPDTISGDNRDLGRPAVGPSGRHSKPVGRPHDKQ